MGLQRKGPGSAAKLPGSLFRLCFCPVPFSASAMPRFEKYLTCICKTAFSKIKAIYRNFDIFLVSFMISICSPPPAEWRRPLVKRRILKSCFGRFSERIFLLGGLSTLQKMSGCTLTIRKPIVDCFFKFSVAAMSCPHSISRIRKLSSVKLTKALHAPIRLFSRISLQ